MSTVENKAIQTRRKERKRESEREMTAKLEVGRENKQGKRERGHNGHNAHIDRDTE
jgi:hypothetical protein